jgi:hypothetical protein
MPMPPAVAASVLMLLMLMVGPSVADHVMLW